MKKRSRPSAPSQPVVTAPSGDASAASASENTTGATKLEFAYYGAADSAKGFNGGRLVQHAMRHEDGTCTFVLSLRGGPHERRTLVELVATALLGPCIVAIKGGETRTLQAGDPAMTIPPGSTFTLETGAQAVLRITSLGDPGLGGGRRDDDNLE